MKHIFTIIFSLFLSINLTYSLTIKGLVMDEKTKEPLVGATVSLTNTKFGTNVGLDGSYEIKNIPSGSYNVLVRFVGYKTLQKNVNITSGMLVENFSLSEDLNELNEVVVTGQTDRETDNSIRKSEQKADNVLNIIGAKSIQLLPDITVGNVLQRISGVSVVRNSSGDGQYAIIRGMDKRYNYTLVNGIKIPSSDNKNRYVPMDIFPAEMLERLEVVKALTPNMEGDAIGGVMNMVMKSAPDHLVLSATGSTGYSNLFGNRPFSGYDSKDIAFQSPAQIKGNQYVAQPSDFSTKTLQYKDVSMPLNTLFGLTVGNRIFNKKLGFVLAGSYQKTYRGSNSIYYNANGQPSPDPQPNTPLFDRIENRQYNTLQTRAGVHLKLDYALNKNHKLSLYNLFLQLDEDLHRHIETVNDNSGAEQSINDRSRFTRQNIYNTTLQGNHNLSNKLKLNWSVVYSNASAKTPDWKDMSVTFNPQKDVNGKPIDNAKYINAVTNRWTQNSDIDKAAYLNLTYNFKKDFEITIGGMFRDKNRVNDYDEYKLTAVPSTTGIFRQTYTTIEKATFFFQQVLDSKPKLTDANNFLASEKVTAGYIQSKFLINNKLQIVGGVRAEHTSQSYNSQLPAIFEGRDGKIDYLDILPSIHFKYVLNNLQNIRMSYFKGISRPGYFEYVPAIIAGDYFDEGGNFNLKHTQSDNIDLRYEFFPKGSEQLLIGTFFKNIVNPIEYGFEQIGNNSSKYTPQNFGTATNYGLELVFTKYFKNWGVSGNYTYTHSAITTTKRVYYRDKNGNIQNASASQPTNEYPTSPTQTRPLQGQSDHIGNLSLIYKNVNLGFDAQLSWVYTGARINIVSAYKDLDYWQKATSQLDFSTEKRIGKSFSVFVKATNLLNNPIIVEILKDNTQKGSPEQTENDRTLVQKDVFNQTFLVGFRYKLP